MRARRGPSESYVRSKAPPWFNVDAARRVQRRIASSVLARDPEVIEYVAGVDVAYRGDTAYAAAVLYSRSSKRLIDWAYDVSKVVFPYVPTLLAFRELTPMLRALMKLRVKPHLVFVDGQGIAHPFRAGIASHLGVTLGISSVGVAKKLLYGVVEGEGEAPVLDPDTRQIIGWAIKCGSRTVYVSIGHRVTLETAVNLVKEFCVGASAPLPLMDAHIKASEIRRGRKY